MFFGIHKQSHSLHGFIVILHIECGKSVPIYLYTLKMTCLGCFKIKGEGGDNNATGLKEEEGIEMSIYSAFHIRDARSPSLLYLLTWKRPLIFRKPVRKPTWRFWVHWDHSSCCCWGCPVLLFSFLHQRIIVRLISATRI